MVLDLGLSKAVAGEAATRVRIGAGHIYGGVSFAPDGSEIGVGKQRKLSAPQAWFGDPLRDTTTTRYSLPGGRRIRRYHADPSRFVHLGEAVVYVTGLGARGYRVTRYGPRGREHLWAGETWPYVSPTQIPGGFAVGIGNRLLAGTAEAGSGLREIPLPGISLEHPTARIAHLTSDPLSGRLAFVRIGPHREPPAIVVLDAGFGVAGLVASVCDHPYWLSFCGPGTLLVRGAGVLESWQAGPPLALAASASSVPLASLMPLPLAGLIAVDPGNITKTRQRLWLDARTLTPSDAPPALRDAPQFWVSPSGQHAAVRRGRGHLEVRDLRLDEIARILSRPLATASPADLATVRSVQSLSLGPAATAAIDLLRACLEHRFA